MGYWLGVDLGTTYTAAAVYREGRVEIAPLGNRAPTVPSVVLLKDDESILAGEAAQRRGITEPERVAREFKRRVGDPTPLVLGGSPYSAEAVTAKLLRWVVDRVTELEGSAPDRVAVTHPANWGNYKTDLLSQAVRLADLGDAVLLTEPEAAAAYYASQERVEVGAIIAVYDLGGGTFDAAVLRKTVDGWDILGEPEGIERLGGIDFDEAVFQHVRRAAEPQLADLDREDQSAMAAVARLRHECVDAKEALSNDTDVGIPVLLPNLQTEVRLTRAEFERMIRPTLQDTIGALQRALGSAGVTPEEVSAVLLVGGSSRIPLVAQLVGAEFGRPVAVDAHPKHAVALGAAMAAAEDSPPAQVDEGGPAPTAAVAPPSAPPPPQRPAPPTADDLPSPATTGGGRRALLVGGAAVLVVAAIAAVLLAGGGGGGDDTDVRSSDEVTIADAPTASEAASTTIAATTTTTRAGPSVEMTDVRLARGRYIIDFTTNGFTPSVPDPAARHVHFFWDTTAPENAGANGPDPGGWLLWDAPTTVDDPFFDVGNRPGGAEAICSLVATHEHGVADVDGDRTPDTETGNCLPLPGS